MGKASRFMVAWSGVVAPRLVLAEAAQMVRLRTIDRPALVQCANALRSVMIFVIILVPITPDSLRFVYFGTIAISICPTSIPIGLPIGQSKWQ